MHWTKEYITSDKTFHNMSSITCILLTITKESLKFMGAQLCD